MSVKFISAVLHGSKTTCIHFAVHTCRTIIDQKWQEGNESLKAKLKVHIFLFFGKVINGSTDNNSENSLCFTHAAHDNGWFTKKKKEFHIRAANRTFPKGWLPVTKDQQQSKFLPLLKTKRLSCRAGKQLTDTGEKSNPEIREESQIR